MNTTIEFDDALEIAIEKSLAGFKARVRAINKKSRALKLAIKTPVVKKSL
jgi:hypothetical protein